MEQSASVVGNRFVLKYYTALNQKPESVYQFYKANSAFTFGLEDESTTTPEDTVIGSENIRKKIDSLAFHDCKVTLAVVDCQDSLNGGVLVTVIGYLSNKGETPRKFVQTFFLAVQTEPVGYFVLNSVFRYLKDPTVFPQPNIKTPAVQQSPQVQQLQQVAEVQQTPKETEKPAPAPAPTPAPAPVQTQSAPAPTPAPVKETKVEQPKAEPKVEANHKPEQKKPEPAPVQPPAPTQEAPKAQKPAPKTNEKSEAPAQQNHKEQKSKGKEKEKEKEKEQPAEKKAPQPGTWAAMLSNNQEKPPKPTAQPKIQSPQPPAKPATQAPAKPVEKEVKEKPAEKEGKEKEAQKPQKEQKSHPGFTPLKEELTVFVSNVPFQATEEQVRACFSKAGDIKSVVLRASSGYSFVEFANEETLHKALQLHKAGPFVMEGRQLSLEEKKPNWDKIEKKEYKKDYGFKKDKKPFKKDGANGKTDKPKKDKPFLKEGITAPSQ